MSSDCLFDCLPFIVLSCFICWSLDRTKRCSQSRRIKLCLRQSNERTDIILFNQNTARYSVNSDLIETVALLSRSSSVRVGCSFCHTVTFPAFLEIMQRWFRASIHDLFFRQNSIVFVFRICKLLQVYSYSFTHLDLKDKQRELT